MMGEGKLEFRKRVDASAYPIVDLDFVVGIPQQIRSRWELWDIIHWWWLIHVIASAAMLGAVFAGERSAAAS